MNPQTMFFLSQWITAIFLLRVWVQLARADYYNPVTNRFVRILSPLVNTIGTVLRPIGKINTAALTLAFLVATVSMVIFFPSGNLFAWLLGGLAFTFSVCLSMIFWTLLGMVISSWLLPPQNPWYQLVGQLMRPIMAPIQRVIPNFGGLDFSPVVVFLLIQLMRGVIETKLFLLSGLEGV